MTTMAENPNKPITAQGDELRDVRRDAPDKPESLWKDVWYSLSHNVAAMISLVFIGVLVLIALFTLVAPDMLPYDPYKQELTMSFAAPSAELWFGCDQQGRDMFRPYQT